MRRSPDSTRRADNRRITWDARIRGRGVAAITSVAIAALVIAGCGGSGSATKGGSGGSDGGGGSAGHGTTLQTAFSFDPGSLDPDIFYGNEGLEVTTSCYDGLLQYQNNTTKIIPDLATSYSVTDGGKTYTFHLRPGVKFSDGTPMNSAAIKFDIQRRAAVNGGPAYMVAPITSIGTPSSTTLVLHLKTPENPFPSWLASPYGLKAISPTAIKQHSLSKKDDGQKWLATHCAGTGPYTLTDVTAGQRYVLAANPNYWGSKPDFTKVDITVIPNFSTQELELKSGALDVMTHGISSTDLPAFENNSSFQVVRLPGISAMNLWINLHSPNLLNPTARKAIGLALDRQHLVQQVYSDNATVYNSFFAPDTLPDKYGYKVPYDAAQAKSIVSKLPASQRSLTLVYTTDDATNQQLAGLMGQELGAAGFKVVLRGVPETEVFNYGTDPESKRPDMLVLPQNPDDASPSSFPQLQWVSTPGAGGFFTPFDPAADKVLESAQQSSNDATATSLYGKAALMYGARTRWCRSQTPRPSSSRARGCRTSASNGKDFGHLISRRCTTADRCERSSRRWRSQT